MTKYLDRARGSAIANLTTPRRVLSHMSSSGEIKMSLRLMTLGRLATRPRRIVRFLDTHFHDGGASTA